MAAFINALLCAVNVACYFGAGHHWYSAAAAAFLGLLAIICAIEEA